MNFIVLKINIDYRERERTENMFLKKIYDSGQCWRSHYKRLVIWNFLQRVSNLFVEENPSPFPFGENVSTAGSSERELDGRLLVGEDLYIREREMMNDRGGNNPWPVISNSLKKKPLKWQAAKIKKKKAYICFCVVVVVVVVVPTLYRHAGQKDEVLHGNLPPIPFNDY